MFHHIIIKTTYRSNAGGAAMKLCVFGDSIAKGIVFNTVSARYETLKLNMMELLGLRKDVNFKNHSMFGCTVEKGLSLIERYEDELAVYDTVLLGFGGNDCNFPWNEIADAPEKSHQPKIPIETFIQTYKIVIEKIKKAGIKPVLLTLPPLDAKRFFNWVSKGINAEGILKWLGDVNIIYRWQEMYSMVVLSFEKTLGVPVIDVRSKFLCRQDLPELIGVDGMHPTRKGYELIVKTVYEQLAQKR